MFFHSCLKSPGRLPNVGLPTAAGDLVDNLGLLLCGQCVLNSGQDGPEGSPGFEDHPQARPNFQQTRLMSLHAATSTGDAPLCLRYQRGHQAMSLSFWSFLIAGCKPGLRLLFGGLVVWRMALTVDLRCCADTSFSCRAVASVEAIILIIGICRGVVTKLSSSARTSSSKPQKHVSYRGTCPKAVVPAIHCSSHRHD